VEFNEDDAPPNGPWTMVEFTKGNNVVTLTPSGNAYFHDIELVYTPATLPDPTIEITSPGNNATINELPFNVEFEVTNFDPTNGDGYIGLYISDGFVDYYDNLDPISVDEFPEGTNDLKLMLLDTALIPLDPEISDEISLTWNPIGTEDILITGKLLGNYPNPFNPSTTIYFNIEQNANFELTIYNVKGEKIKTFRNHQITQSTNQQITWDGTDEANKPVASSVYYYVLKTNDSINSKKMLLLK
jgi:hypothetical protein